MLDCVKNYTNQFDFNINMSNMDLSNDIFRYSLNTAKVELVGCHMSECV